jgi:endoglucanase
MWDYQGGFGLFNKGSNEIFEYDVNRALAEAIGFTPPPFKEYEFTPDTVGFDIYTDFPGKYIVQGGVGSILSTDSYEGEYAVYLTDMEQYTALDFDFKFNKDLSILRASNTVLNFWVKGTSTEANVVLRFLDTKTNDPKDHPWRMDYTLRSTNNAPFDGNWYNVTVPLKSFVDIGSWDNAWFNSEKKFDWKAVDKFQIVAENMALTGKEFWFDNIKLIKGEPDPVANSVVGNYPELTIYPNPAKENVQIGFFAPRSGMLEVTIHDLAGRKITTVFHGEAQFGKQEFKWDFTNRADRTVANGIYICKLKFGNKEITRKISVLK